MAKAATWTNTDTEARKRGEQTGLDTLVVQRPKRCELDVGCNLARSIEANALSSPPGEYGRKTETQRN